MSYSYQVYSKAKLGYAYIAPHIEARKLSQAKYQYHWQIGILEQKCLFGVHLHALMWVDVRFPSSWWREEISMYLQLLPELPSSGEWEGSGKPKGISAPTMQTWIKSINKTTAIFMLALASLKTEFGNEYILFVCCRNHLKILDFSGLLWCSYRWFFLNIFFLSFSSLLFCPWIFYFQSLVDPGGKTTETKMIGEVSGLVKYD